MSSIQRKAYTVREFAEMYGKSPSWGKHEVESGRIEARFPAREAAWQDDNRRGDQPVGEVVECRSWRTRDDKPLRLIDMLDEDGIMILVLDAAGLVAFIASLWVVLGL